MSMRERTKHLRKGISKERSVHHKHDGHKLAIVVNHVHYERNHGYESAKRSEGLQPGAAG